MKSLDDLTITIHCTPTSGLLVTIHTPRTPHETTPFPVDAEEVLSDPEKIGKVVAHAVEMYRMKSSHLGGLSALVGRWPGEDSQ